MRIHSWPTRHARRSMAALPLAALLVLVVGCGTQQSEQAPVSKASDDHSTGQARTGSGSSTEPMSHGASGSTEVAAATSPRQAHTVSNGRSGTVHRITLSNKRCVEFEPQWTAIRLGESITWRSELETPITIYVSPGVFKRLSFRVRPGATVSTGPALAAGRFSFSTEPTACREAPRGVLLSGPGVSVEENLYASSGPR